MANATELTIHERLAYNLAGHGVVGFHINIHVELLKISGDEGDVKFAPLREICDLRRSPRKHIAHCAKRYAMFTLSGLASELSRIERHHGISPQLDTRMCFLRKWQQILFDDAPLDIEYAYAMTAAWLRADNTSDVAYQLNRIWSSTVDLIASKRVWRQIEQVAGRLLSEGSLSGDDVRSMLDRGTA